MEGNVSPKLVDIFNYVIMISVSKIDALLGLT